MEWLARAIGAFYVFAGVVVLNAVRTELFMDKVLATLGEPEDRADKVRVANLAVGGVITLAGGLLLLWPSRWAAAVFLLNCAVQAAYLAWARRAIPAASLDDPNGRGRTINAFVIYLAATAVVLWMLTVGVLR